MPGYLAKLIQSVVLTLCYVAAAPAQLTIEITQGVEGALPLAVVPFSAGLPLSESEDVSAIIHADLGRSGRFDLLPVISMPARPSNLAEIRPEVWRSSRVDYLVVGQITPVGAELSVQYALADALQGQPLLNEAYTVDRAGLRRLAHIISDRIYQQLTGERGAFNTRIAYVTTERKVGGGDYRLIVADTDGFNPQIILRSSDPIMSPAWSPDGRRLAYVSLENRRAQIYIQDLFSGQRQLLTAETGINGAPSWSPDGRRMALTLSRDGNPEIYLYNLLNRTLSRLTNNTAIDTEPVWSPDGSSIVFTSDRGGSPQLYQISVSGGQAQRLTFQGNYNARASFAPDGRSIAFVHRSNGRFRIAVQNLSSGQLRILTNGDLDESPSFAPNGQMIVYATSLAGRGELAAVSADGKVQQRLVLRSGEVREPAWAPFNN
ncbi:MAG: Tol-Pal system beta propeller repeat protein TolB [Candidatus Competibacteraceae bacterium]|nr:Tol-Pal system beta propeller repeat protein TolB [Candidatus Competibacteraceae bacterium]